MAGTIAPNIVTDGLVLYLDAANVKSYPGSGTVWRDIVGSNNGTLTNGPIYSSTNGGSIVFDGMNDYVNTNSSINTGQNFSIGIWAFLTKSGRNALFVNSYPFTPNVGWYFFIGGFSRVNNISLAIGNDQAYSFTAANAFNTNRWNNFAATVSNGGSNILLYINGVLQTDVTTQLTSINIQYTTTNWKVGALISPVADYMGGNISQTQIYNRTLSSQEILQNYNATKTRFGL